MEHFFRYRIGERVNFGGKGYRIKSLVLGTDKGVTKMKVVLEDLATGKVWKGVFSGEELKEKLSKLKED